MSRRARSEADTVARFTSLDTSDGGCWNWPHSKDTQGYGCISFRGRQRIAHRLAYELLVGPIPDGLQIDHLCHNRACVNPAHLEPVTVEVNIRRRLMERDGHIGPGKAAHLLGVSTRTILRWTADGRLPLAALSDGGHRRYRLADVERLAQERAA